MAAVHALPVADMEWRAEGILLSVRRHGENAAIIEVLTAEHGRHAGLVRGGSGRRMAPVLQPGNHLALRWRARLSEHLGSFDAELIRAHAAEAMADREALATLDAMRALACKLLPERASAPELYADTLALLGTLGNEGARRGAYARWEVALLAELGFGLDLRRCAASGRTDSLRFVSPRSGCAVSAESGAAYADRLLPLPGFLGGTATEPDRTAFGEALAMTGYFLERWAGEPLGLRGVPPARERLAALIAAR